MQNEVEIRITMKDEQNLRPNSTDTPQKQLSAVLPRRTARRREIRIAMKDK